MSYNMCSYTFSSFQIVSCLFILVISPLVRASGGLREKKVKFRGIFRDKFVEKAADFVGIFEANFAEKRLVKNGRFCESFLSKFCWKAIGFALI